MILSATRLTMIDSRKILPALAVAGISAAFTGGVSYYIRQQEKIQITLVDSKITTPVEDSVSISISDLLAIDRTTTEDIAELDQYKAEFLSGAEGLRKSTASDSSNNSELSLLSVISRLKNKINSDQVVVVSTERMKEIVRLSQEHPRKSRSNEDNIDQTRIDRLLVEVRDTVDSTKTPKEKWEDLRRHYNQANQSDVFEAWSALFTPNAVFQPNGMATPVGQRMLNALLETTRSKTSRRGGEEDSKVVKKYMDLLSKKDQEKLMKNSLQFSAVIANNGEIPIVVSQWARAVIGKEMPIEYDLKVSTPDNRNVVILPGQAQVVTLTGENKQNVPDKMNAIEARVSSGTHAKLRMYVTSSNRVMDTEFVAIWQKDTERQEVIKKISSE